MPFPCDKWTATTIYLLTAGTGARHAVAEGGGGGGGRSGKGGGSGSARRAAEEGPVDGGMEGWVKDGGGMIGHAKEPATPALGKDTSWAGPCRASRPPGRHVMRHQPPQKGRKRRKKWARRRAGLASCVLCVCGLGPPCSHGLAPRLFSFPRSMLPWRAQKTWGGAAWGPRAWLLFPPQGGTDTLSTHSSCAAMEEPL